MLGSSSNFGKMFSMDGGTLCLPYVPMLPLPRQPARQPADCLAGRAAARGGGGGRAAAVAAVRRRAGLRRAAARLVCGAGRHRRRLPRGHVLGQADVLLALGTAQREGAMKALDRKRFRDLWHLRGQVLAIAAVIMGGVATMVMSRSTYDSLVTTRDRFYSEYRLADVFASLKRAPEPVAERLAALP